MTKLVAIRCFFLASSALLLGALTATASAQTPQPASAGSQIGTVTGRVMDEATQASLANSLIKLEGTNYFALTGPDGRYSLVAPAGSHRMTVSYTGLEAVTLPVTVRAGSLVTEDVSLRTSIYMLEKLVIEGAREENALALQAQQTSANPKTVIAIGAHGNPAVNPGELIQRMAGVAMEMASGEAAVVYIRGLNTQFSNLLVDGDPVAVGYGNPNVGRNFSMNQYATSNLSQIELIKAPTPDQDASAIAGSINMQTRRGFDRLRRDVSISVGSMATDRGFRPHTFTDRFKLGEIFSFSYAEPFSVFGRKNNLGIAINFSRRYAEWVREEHGSLNFANISSGHLNATSDNPLQRIFGGGEYGSPSETDTYGLNLDYRINDNSSVYVRLAMTDNNNGPQVSFRNGIGNVAATAAQFAPGSTYELSTLLPSAASVSRLRSNTSHRFNNTKTHTAGLDQKLFNRTVTLNLSASYSEVHSYNPLFSSVDAVATGIGFTLDRRGQDPWYPLFTQTAGPDVRDPASYRVDIFSRQNPGMKVTRESYRLDLKKEFATRFPAYIKAGGKSVFEKRVIRRDWEQFTFVGPDGVPGTADDNVARYEHAPTFHTRRTDGPYPYLPLPDFTVGNRLDPHSAFPNFPFGTSQGNLWAETAADAYTSLVNSLNVDGTISERIDAAYIMGHVSFGKIRAVTGVRFEKTTVKAGAWERNATATWGGNSVGGASRDPAVVAANRARADRSFVRYRNTRNSYDHFFPGAHLVYEPGSGWVGRLSYNRSISRPQIAQLQPVSTVNEENRTAVLGNPALRPFSSENYELSVERYFEPVGLISVGVFYKDISDYSRQFQVVAGPEGIDGDPNFAGYLVSQFRNIGSATVQGYELSYQQRLEKWLRWTKHVSVFANYTRLRAEGDFGTTTTTNRLARMVPHTANAGITFNNRKLDIRLLVNYTGRQYVNTISGLDLYWADRTTYDLKLQYAHTRNWQLFADVVNLTNEQNRADVAENGLRHLLFNTGTIYTVGVNWRL